MNGKLKPRNIKIGANSVENDAVFDSFIDDFQPIFKLQYPSTETPKIRVIDMKKKKHGLF